MSTTNKCECFKFRGKVFARLTDEAGAIFNAENDPLRPWFEIGGIQEYTLNVQTTTDRVKDYSNGCCVADLCRDEQVDSLEITLTAACLSPETAALGFRGNVVNIPAGAKSLPAFKVTKGGIIPLGAFVQAGSVVVSGGLVLNTDYVVENGIVRILSTAPNVPAAGVDVNVDWVQTADDRRIEMFANCVAKKYEVMFSGVNCATGREVIEYLYRVQMSGASSFALISDNFGKIQLKGAILADNRVASPASPFGTLSGI